MQCQLWRWRWIAGELRAPVVLRAPVALTAAAWEPLAMIEKVLVEGPTDGQSVVPVLLEEVVLWWCRGWLLRWLQGIVVETELVQKLDDVSELELDDVLGMDGAPTESELDGVLQLVDELEGKSGKPFEWRVVVIE